MKNSTYIIKPLLFNLDKALDISSLIALIVLFFTETSYYLLILQTGVVELYNSDITQIWTTPLFGIIGMLVALKLKYRHNFIIMALIMQTMVIFFYPHFNLYSLAILGFSSGVIAPYLIYQLRSLTMVVIGLGFAYAFSTVAITIPAIDRGTLATALSLVALVAIFFIDTTPIKKGAKLDRGYFQLFVWLLLDATLFEILSRSDMAIWRDYNFVIPIILSHLTGLFLAYRFHNFRYNSILVMGLFVLSYLLFALENQYLLAIIYPIVISYYNVLVLKRFMELSMADLTLASLSLWLSAGMGLGISILYT